MIPRIGITLPSFVRDPETPLTVARAAEQAGLDGVFLFDHLWRRAADGTTRPALEATTLLGAVAAETSRIHVGTLVARATLRPAASLAAALETAARVAPGRVLAGLGVGDSENREENESAGLSFGNAKSRLEELRTAVHEVRGRGVTVWVGGAAGSVRMLAAAEADGWNRWGGALERFASEATEVRAAALHTPFSCSWAGLVALGRNEDEAADKARRLRAGPDVLVGGPETIAKALRAWHGAGADWVIVGPLDSSDPSNAALLGGSVLPRLAP